MVSFVVNDTCIAVVEGDLTEQDVDVVVNAANERLNGGGGVDGAIHRRGGPAIMHECDIIRNESEGCRVGQVVMTTAGDLPSRNVIYTDGLVWTGGDRDEDNLLASAYRESLALARDRGHRTWPCRRSAPGCTGFRIERSAAIALDAAVASTDGGGLEEIRMVLFSADVYDQYAGVAMSNYGAIDRRRTG
ncbi:MAG: macro domain-containing protein [Chloroflexota bacterium]|jgi:O-acetyl-ADP-ribose deacetylase (regulator of RNase III)|nr:macro domain-containing protein [Chloroflexota bacterium]MDP6507666.1 macro domain-containing protein [Chloroflexota bacterium]MDP6757559.1 macro domain-containing protein [Chloroflexota bacterium]